MLSRDKVINNNLNKLVYTCILKIDSPKNISLNNRNFNYRSGNIRHSYILTSMMRLLANAG